MAATVAANDWKASCVACGELLCQKDTYAKTCKATVLRCEQVQAPPSKKKGKSKPKDAYDVVLSDTVLFPEGGGQPFDVGVIGDSTVTQVTNGLSNSHLQALARMFDLLRRRFHA